ncbi:MAG: hypothetical protein R2784_10415 [Saprospiraceae bacterium]
MYYLKNEKNQAYGQNTYYYFEPYNVCQYIGVIMSLRPSVGGPQMPSVLVVLTLK